jgi:hypothetical protein
MTELSPLEQRAAAAHHDYMSLGNEVQMGRVPLIDLQSWVTDITPVRLPPHQAYDAGWLCLEAAMTRGPAPEVETGSNAEMYSPQTLAARSVEYWRDITLRPSNPVQLRARATVAMAAMGAYGVMAQIKDKTPAANFHQAQIDSLTMLHKAYDRHHNPELLHDLHVQTLMFMLNSSAAHKDTDMTLPLPSRYYNEGAIRSDLLFWTAAGGEHDLPCTYLLGISAQDGTANHYVLNVPPTVLRNDVYSSSALALQAYDVSKPELKDPFKKKHLRDVVANIRTLIRSQIETGAVTASSNIDPEAGLQDAYDWYANLGPSYQMKPGDRQMLEQVINPFEMAAAKNETDAEDLLTLGWLWMEMDMATGEKGGFARAEDCFEMAASTAEAEEDWPLYCNAKLDKAVAGFRRRLQEPEEQESESALEMYQQDLRGIAEGVVAGLRELPKTSPYFEDFQRFGRRLAANLLFADGNEGYTAFAPSSRQRGIYREEANGSDILLVPEIDGEYPINGAGKVCFDSVRRDALLDEGVASISVLETFGKENIENISPLLQTILNGESNFLTERIKKRVLEAGQRSMDTTV